MLKIFLAATLYTALSVTAIPASALDVAALDALKDGDMKKLVLHSAPKPVSEETFFTTSGDEIHLSDFSGSITVVNFWATWCAPCRKEMPALDALASEFSAAGLNVIPIATGHNPQPAIDRFFEEAGIEELESRLDTKSKLARDMAVLGLPVTLIMDQNGMEIGRLTGDADWHSSSAREILQSLLDDMKESDD